MSDLKTSIILDLAGNLERQAKRFTGSLGRLSSQGSRHMGALSRSVSVVGRGLDRLGNRYTALITGAAGLGTVRMVANLEERFTRLGIQSNRSADDIDALKKRIYEVAKSAEVRVDPGQITSAIEEIVEKTGDLDFAEKSIRSIGIAIQATGAEGQSIGGILAEFQKMGLSANEAFEALDILTVQGKEGAFTLQNLAALGPRVVTAYTAMGRTGVPAIREMGAALQVIRQGTGSAEMAATAFEALLRTLGDADKVKALQNGGIQIFEPGTTDTMRSLPDIMEQIISKTKGSKMVLSKVFDAEAIRAFNAAAGEFQRTGRVDSLRKFYQVQADGSTITKDSIRAAKTFNAALTNLYTIWKQFADDQLTEPIKHLTEYLNGLEPGTVERWLAVGKNVAIAGAGAIAVSKALRVGADLKTLFGRRGGKAGGALGGAFGDAIPVYVVNGPMSNWGGGAAGTAAGTATGTAAGAGIIPIAAAGMIPAAGAAAVAVGSRAAGKAAARWQAGIYTKDQLQQLRARQMVMGGGPDSFQVKTIDAELQRRDSEWVRNFAQGMQGKLKIEIEGAPVKVKELNGRNLDIEVDSGRIMAGH